MEPRLYSASAGPWVQGRVQVIVDDVAKDRHCDTRPVAVILYATSVFTANIPWIRDFIKLTNYTEKHNDGFNSLQCLFNIDLDFLYFS